MRPKRGGIGVSPAQSHIAGERSGALKVGKLSSPSLGGVPGTFVVLSGNGISSDLLQCLSLQQAVRSLETQEPNGGLADFCQRSNPGPIQAEMHLPTVDARVGQTSEAVLRADHCAFINSPAVVQAPARTCSLRKSSTSA